MRQKPTYDSLTDNMAIQTIEAKTPVQCVENAAGRNVPVVYDDITFYVDQLIHHQDTTGFVPAVAIGPGSRPMHNRFSDCLRGTMVKMCLLICLLIWAYIFFSYLYN